ncbi:MAG: S9 family peptidase [Bacteroidota bacterium]|nr:S9 family peptidase [Bacteroidota bacterium]
MKRIWKYTLFLPLLALISCGDMTGDVSKKQNELIIENSLTEEEITQGILTPEVLWKFNRIGSAVLSPNGETVAFSITKYSLEANKGLTHIYLIPTEGGEMLQLTDGNASCYHPEWIAGGERIAYLSADDSGTQVWSVNLDGKDVKKASEIEDGVSHFDFAPNGEKLLFCKNVKLEESSQDIYPDLPEANVHMAEELMYRHWNHWKDGSHSHIFIAKTSEKITEGKDIMEGETYDAPLSPYYDYSEITWSPNSDMIAYTCKKMSKNEYTVSTDSDIYLYHCENGETENVSAPNSGYDKYPTFSNDGSKIAWEQMKIAEYESDRTRLVVYDLNNESLINYTEDFDQSVGSINWSANDEDVYFISGIHATYQICKINLNTKEIIQLTEGEHNYNSIQLYKDQLLANRMSISQASELYVVDTEGNDRQLTAVNQFIYDEIEMGEVREEWVETTDGKEMLVWLILPPNFDENKEYPAILYCQGGPQSAVSQFFSYRWNFQIMAANGYVIIAPNRRGLPTFGTEWNEQISGDYGGQNMKDYFSATDAMAEKQFIDKDRIGAIGASYGGFSVFWLAGHHEGRFNAFISHCGMFNLESQYNATDEYFFVNKDLGGAYWEKDNEIAQKSYANSPHRFVDKWDTPILIITGENDFRIPYTESLQAFNAAQLNGVESKLLVFPDETHFVLKPQNSVLWQREFKNWLDIHLK